MKGIREFGVAALALLTVAGRGESQVWMSDVRQVRWPLIDVVMAPDSAWGLLLLAAPTSGTVQWKRWRKGSSPVNLKLDPVYALQWATRARELLRDDSAAAASKAVRVAPALRSRHGGAFLVLGREQKRPKEQRFVLVVSDTGSKTQWKTFAGPDEVDMLLSALEETGEKGWVLASTRETVDSAGDDDFDEPVAIVSQPAPLYPESLASSGREGRVWLVYAVGANGRPEPDSFQPLLSDDPLFSEAAIKALMHSKFRPAIKDGRPVRMRVFQVIAFRQQER